MAEYIKTTYLKLYRKEFLNGVKKMICGIIFSVIVCYADFSKGFLVPPSIPTFLNTMEIDGCESCINVKINTNADITCQVVEGGTLPVTVKIVIAGEEGGKCNFDKSSYTKCKMTEYITSSLHLKEIRCEAVNEAISDPLSTSTKLYVVVPPSIPTFLNTMDIDGCESCINVKINTDADIICQVLEGGTLPVAVKIVIAGEEGGKCNFDKSAYTKCKMTKYITSSLHLKEIRCEAVNKAISDPLSTSTKLYVVDKKISESREKTLPWKSIGIGAAAGVVVLVLVVILVIKRRRNTDGDKTASENIPMDAPKGPAILNEPRDEQNGSDAYDSIIVATYANVDNRDQGSENVKTAGPSSLKAEANTSEPVPIPEEQDEDLRDTETIRTGAGWQPGTKDLVYADLDLPTEREAI